MGKPAADSLPDAKDHRGEALRPLRLAVFVTHPIQYFAPMFRRLAQRPEIELTVLYASLMGAQPYQDPGFGRTLAWDVPLLEGYRYKTLKNYRPGKTEGFFSFLSPGIIREISRERYDAVLVFGWACLTSWLAFAGARLASVPLMLYGDSIPLFEGANGRLKAALKTLLLGSLFRRTSAFLVMGKLNRAFYESYGAPASKTFFVPYPVDNDFFTLRAERAREHREALRARYGIPPEAVLLLFVGKLVRRKRPQDLLAVLRRLQASLPYLGAVFVGEGELRPWLEAEVARGGMRNAFLLGFKNQTELPEVYAISDILVLPSMREPWGLVANEAMACGLPVVVSNMTGAGGDIVIDGYNGFVYPAGDTDELTRVVRKLVVDSPLREEMGKRSLEMIRRRGYTECIEGILKALYFVNGGSPAPLSSASRSEPRARRGASCGVIE
jgi:glycosyltransferase involved in cell wall biosynthesis